MLWNAEQKKAIAKAVAGFDVERQVVIVIAVEDERVVLEVDGRIVIVAR